MDSINDHGRQDDQDVSSNHAEEQSDDSNGAADGMMTRNILRQEIATNLQKMIPMMMMRDNGCGPVKSCK
jgi:hypothetical protein